MKKILLTVCTPIIVVTMASASPTQVPISLSRCFIEQSNDFKQTIYCELQTVIHVSYGGGQVEDIALSAEGATCAEAGRTLDQYRAITAIGAFMSGGYAY